MQLDKNTKFLLLKFQRNMAQFRHYEGRAVENDLRYFTWKGMRKNFAVSKKSCDKKLEGPIKIHT